MRTSGTFQDVYDAAKSYSNDTAEDGSPINPVIRRECGKWMLESGLEPTDGDFECNLSDFDNWFYEAYQNDEYVPSDDDVNDFLAAFNEYLSC